MRFFNIALGAGLALAASSADGASTDHWPTPPPRPPDLKAAPEEAPSLPPPAAEPSSASPECLAELANAHVEAESAPAPSASSSDCAIPNPVRLKSIGLASGAAIDFPARPLLDCRFAATLADFVRTAAAPLASGLLGSPLTALDTGPGYACRGRNQVPGARTSAHGEGIAIDVMAFVLADKRRITVAAPSGAEGTAFIHGVRRAACGWFTTILGPGSDAAHASHLHLDTLAHGGNDHYRICE